MPQFDESKHPRAEDGKFTEKGNGTATSKKEKEYNPKGSSLKAGDSISYKEDTKYGGERRKGKIASIDGDTIITTDGKKINKFNAFKDDELEDVSFTDFLESDTLKKLDEYRKRYDYSVEDIDKGLDVRFKAGMNTKDAVEDLKESMVALEDITKFNPSTKTYETGNIGYHKGYGIDYNIYGGGEFSVQVNGDDVMFKTEQEARDFIDEVTGEKKSGLTTVGDEEVLEDAEDLWVSTIDDQEEWDKLTEEEKTALVLAHSPIASAFTEEERNEYAKIYEKVAPRFSRGLGHGYSNEKEEPQKKSKLPF